MCQSVARDATACRVASGSSEQFFCESFPFACEVHSLLLQAMVVLVKKKKMKMLELGIGIRFENFLTRLLHVTVRLLHR
jgi:hypothetical protein